MKKLYSGVNVALQRFARRRRASPWRRPRDACRSSRSICAVASSISRAWTRSSARPHRAPVPGLAARVVVAVEEQARRSRSWSAPTARRTAARLAGAIACGSRVADRRARPRSDRACRAKPSTRCRACRRARSSPASGRSASAACSPSTVRGPMRRMKRGSSIGALRPVKHEIGGDAALGMSTITRSSAAARSPRCGSARRACPCAPC